MKQTNLKSRFPIFALAICACVFSIFTTGASAQEYNPRDEFALTQGGANGLWNYGVSTSDADNTVTLFSATDIRTEASGCSGAFEKWLKEPNGDQLPQIARHNPATTCANIPANAVFMHPGRNNQRAVLRFNAPTSGTFQITGSFQKQNLSATTDLKIIKNGGLPGEIVLYTGAIGALYQQAFNFTVTLTAGDKIDFSVGDGDNGQNSDGSTLAATISQPITACLTAPANLQVNVPAENSPVDVQSVNTNASLVGDATYTNTGKVGRAFELDGSGDYVRIEDNAAQRPATAVTAEGWFKFDSVSGIVSLISKPVRNSAFNSHTLYLENGQLRGLIGNASQYTRALSSFVPQTGVWQHLAFTYDFSGGISTLKLYANGVEVTSGVDGTANLPLFYDANPYPLLIGGEFENNAPGFFLDGQADEVSVYGRALSPNEIFDIVQQGSFGKCSPGSACVTAPNGLVSFYKGEDNALDSNSLNPGTLVNGTTFQSGKVGRGFKFDGVDDQVSIPDSPSLKPQRLTVETWVKFDSLTSNTSGGAANGTQYLVFKKNQASGNFEGFVLNKNPNNTFRFGFGQGNGNPGVVIDSTTLATTGVFYHVVGTYDGATAKIYVNGVLENSVPYNLPLNYDTRPLFLGTSGETFFDGKFNGVLDEVSIYNRAVTATEVSTVFNAGANGKCLTSICAQPPNNLVSWFAGEQNALDSRSNNHGTLQNGATFANGKVGQAFSFDGVDDYVQTPINMTRQTTIEAWVNPSILTGGFMDGSFPGVTRRSIAGAAANAADLSIGLYGGTFGALYRSPSGTPARLQSNLVPQIGQWYHVAVTIDGNTARLYVNGNLEDSGTTAANYTPDPDFRIGGVSCCGADRFGGLVDEVSIYNRNLTAAELQSIYNAGQSGKCKPVGLNPATNQIAWFSGDGDTRDFLGLNPNGILRGDANFRVGRVGQSFNFDGSGDYVEIPDDADHRPANVTVEGWFKVNSLSGSPHFVSKPLVGNNSNSYVVWYQDGQLRGGHGNSSGGFDTLLTGFTPNLGEWYHFAYTIDDAADTHRFFVNGAQIASGATTLPIFYDTANPHPLLIGGELDFNVLGSFLNGQADEVSLYSRALSASELAAIYNAGTAGKSKGKTTATGSNVQTQLSDATVTFANVSAAGMTSQNGIDLGLLPALPSNATFTGLAYNVSTTATYQNGTADDVRVCFNLPSLAGIGAGNLRVLHLEGGAWVDRTASGNTLANFCTDNLGSLSPFVIVQATASATSYSIGGRITSNGVPLSNVMVALNDDTTYYGYITTDTDGYYLWTSPQANVNYTVTPTLANYTFTPSFRRYNNLSANVTDADFTGTTNCTFSFNPESGDLFPAAGGSGSFTVTTQAGCQWTATTNGNATPWVTINNPGSGTGSGTVNYTVAANTTIFRVGDILVNGVVAHTLGQQTGSGTCPQVTPIAYGDPTINGALATSDCVQSGRYTDQYSFSGIAGERVFIRLSSTQFAEALILHNTANTQIYTSATGGAATDARIPNVYGFYTLPATGTYVISVSDWGNGGSPTGNYTLTLHSDRTVPGVQPPSGIIGWYAGEGDTRNQQGAGTGTFNGTETYATDYVGQSFNLNGTDRYIEIPAAQNAFNVSSLTVEAWVNTATLNGDPNTAAPRYRNIASKFNGSGGASWSLDMEDGGEITFYVYDGSLNNYRAVRVNGAAAVLAVGEWKHIAATFDQATQDIKIYVNGTDAGQLVSGSATSISGIGQNNVPVRIGAYQSGTMQGFWQGKLDEVSIYNRAISYSEIASIVDSGRVGKIKQATVANQTTATLGASTVTFPAATSGAVSETALDRDALPALPSGNATRLAFEVSTTAPFSGSAQVCFAVPSVSAAEFANLKIWHREGNAWVDRTAPNNVYPNLCASTPSFSPFAIGQNLAPTAATVNITGRATVGKRGIRNALVTLTESGGTTRTVLSGSSGQYSFPNVRVGQTVILSIRAKRFVFVPDTRVINVTDDLIATDFAAQDNDLISP